MFAYLIVLWACLFSIVLDLPNHYQIHQTTACACKFWRHSVAVTKDAIFGGALDEFASDVAADCCECCGECSQCQELCVAL